MEEQYDPRFFVATAHQMDVARRTDETEPQEVDAGRVYLGSRQCVLRKRARLQELGIRYILMCCDRYSSLCGEVRVTIH